MHTEPSILLISGPPASGKSTLAALLHQRLPSFSLIAKDMLKEALYEAFSADEFAPTRDALAYSARLSSAAMDMLWSVAPHCRDVILEANFRPQSVRERERLLALPGRKLEIYCRCSLEEIQRRFRERAGGRHPAHVLQAVTPEMLAEYQAPFGLTPVLEVSSEGGPTGTPFPRDTVDTVLAQIRRNWPDIEVSGGA